MSDDHPREPQHATQERPHVLVVDDHADSVEVLALLLERVGYDVRTATTGREALATAASFTPHAVLLDLGLPDLDGYAVLAELREMSSLAACTFIALSGRARIEDIERSREAGFHHHLVKPADLDTLLRVLPSAAGC
ncbi:MAG TPA: response regulator [Nannocystaceae bacterium]|nr:response regulator [Nannocystaceae bacterium]